MAVNADPLSDREHRLQEAILAYLESVDQGEPLSQETLIHEYPDRTAELEQSFGDESQLDPILGPLKRLRSVDAAPSETPRTFGEYELLGVLGRDGYRAPLSDVAGMNRYVYTFDDPLLLADPSGNYPVDRNLGGAVHTYLARQFELQARTAGVEVVRFGNRWVSTIARALGAQGVRRNRHRPDFVEAFKGFQSLGTGFAEAIPRFGNWRVRLRSNCPALGRKSRAKRRSQPGNRRCRGPAFR